MRYGHLVAMYEGKQQNTTTEIMQIFGSCSMSVHTKAKHLPSKYITHDAPTSIHPIITLLTRYNSTDKSPPPPQDAVSSNATETAHFYARSQWWACLDTQTQLAMEITAQMWFV
eukprot:787493_1